MMQKTLAAIAKDRRCQALIALMKRGQSKIRNIRSGREAESYIEKAHRNRKNIFTDI